MINKKFALLLLILIGCDSESEHSGAPDRKLRGIKLENLRLRMEKFQGFEIREKSGFITYSIPTNSFYEHGLTNFYGVIIGQEGNETVIRPIVAKQNLPTVSEVYKRVVSKSGSLGDILDMNDYRNYNSTQLYSLVIAWSQAVLLLDRVGENLPIFGLSNGQIDKLNELKSISGIKTICEVHYDVDQMSADKRLARSKELVKLLLLDLK